MRPGGATSAYTTLELHRLGIYQKLNFSLNFIDFSMIFIDITVNMHICETTPYRSRCSGGMTFCDAAECFAEAPGHLGARPDRM